MKAFSFISLMFLITLTLYARENPFVPVATYGGEPPVTPLPVPDFHPKPEPIQVINEAKCIAKPLPPTESAEQNKTSVWKQTPKPRKHPKPILFVEKKIKKRSTPRRKIVHHTRKRHTIHHHHKTIRWRLLYKDTNLQILHKGNQLKILGHDPIVTDFMISNPPRLVLDFGNDFVYYETVRRNISTSSILKQLKIGTHDCFYRVTFMLKHSAKYHLRKIKRGYLISFYR